MKYSINIPTTGWTREQIGTSVRMRMSQPTISFHQEITDTQRLRVALQEQRNGTIVVVDAVLENLTVDPTSPDARAYWIEGSYVPPKYITLVP